MILEASLSLIFNPEDMGFYIGPLYLAADRPDSLDARVFLFKLWIVMVQFAMFTPNKKK